MGVKMTETQLGSIIAVFINIFVLLVAFLYIVAGGLLWLRVRNISRSLKLSQDKDLKSLIILFGVISVITFLVVLV